MRLTPSAAGVPAALILLLVGACSSEAPSLGPGRRGPQGERSVPVTTTAVRTGAIAEHAVYVAELRPRRDVKLSAEVTGRVRRVEVHLGDRVKKGALLAQLDDRQFRQAVREARAAVELAEAGELKARVELDSAKRDLDRKAPLVKKSLLSKGEFDVVTSRHETARSALELARAQTAQAKARLERALLDLGNTKIEAPFDGAVAARNVDPGALVSPGTSLFRMTDVDHLVVRFAAPERDVVRLEKGQEVRVALDALPGLDYRGAVDRISPVVDTETRTTPVEVRLANDGRLKPGMFARVEVTLARRDDAVVVPASAVVRRQDGGDAAVEGVFVVDGETAHYTPVTVGIRSREILEIADGVSVGQEVVTAGHSELKDGAKVRSVDAVETAARAGDGRGS